MTLSSTIIVLGHFANFKLAGDRAVRDAVHLLRREASQNGHVHTISSSVPRAPLRTRRRRRGTKSRHMHRSTRVNVMSDADLEAELAARRAMRARERERYARAMRSEKLSVLEGELMRLRSEISRMDRPAVGGGTPPNTRWEALPGARSSGSRGSLSTAPVPSRNLPSQVPSSLAAPPGPSGPPPPPPPLGMADDEEPIDPERQRREKAERVKRREAKRKEREQAKKPLTLAEIIRGAGPDPMRRLKPSGSTDLPDVHEPEEAKEDFANVLSSLKKTADSDLKVTSDGSDGGNSMTKGVEEGSKPESVKKSRNESVVPGSIKKVGSAQSDRGEPDGSNETPGSLEGEKPVQDNSAPKTFGTNTSKVAVKNVEKETESNCDQKSSVKEDAHLTSVESGVSEQDVRKDVERKKVEDKDLGDKDVDGNDAGDKDVDGIDTGGKDVEERDANGEGMEGEDAREKEGAASMLLAVNAIAAKLPSQVGNTSISTKTGDTRKPPLSSGQKRLSLEQRRQLRRDTGSAAKSSSDGLDGDASVDTSNVRTE